MGKWGEIENKIKDFKHIKGQPEIPKSKPSKKAKPVKVEKMFIGNYNGLLGKFYPYGKWTPARKYISRQKALEAIKACSTQSFYGKDFVFKIKENYESIY